jgi:hypothetical protein
MIPLVATNIEQSFKRLAENGANYRADFQSIASKEPSYKKPFAVDGLTFRPILYRKGADLLSAQEDYLGFYALQQAIRGLLLGVNHCVGGNVLLVEELYGPAVASYYTAAFHGLYGFLALSGRVFLDSTSWPIESQRPPGDQSERFIAVLTRRNQWILELRPRNHRSRWGEVRQVHAVNPDSLPECFEILFNYMYRGCHQPGVALVEAINNPQKYRVRLADRLDQFLERIAESRHDSLYASFGSDPNVMEALWNGDTFTEHGIENQAIHFGAFALALLIDVGRDLNDLIRRISITPEIKTALALSVLSPWFDTPRIASVANDELRQSVQDINEWLHADVVADS